MDNSLTYSTTLKSKYGPNFFTDYLRRRGAPLIIRNNNQLFGILRELLTYLQSKNDNSNATIITYIDNLSKLRYENDRAESLRLLENLGLNDGFLPRSATLPTNVATLPTNVPLIATPNVPLIATLPTNVSVISPTQTPGNTENIEKVSYLRGLPEDVECPICLEKLDGSGYSTEKCHNFFHKQCLESHCLGKINCPCPICRRALRFINKKGGKKVGKKRRTKKNKPSKKGKKFKVSRKR